MIHNTRVFRVTQVQTAEELAEKLTLSSWTLCTAFELSGVLFLNDSFGGDGAGEWVVVRGDQEIESVTFSWCSYERGLELIHWLLGGGGGEYGRASLRLDHPQGSCHLCQ